MVLFDSHAHLCDPVFTSCLPQILDRASQAGVSRIVDVGYNRPTIERSVQISSFNENVFSAFGFHPHDAKDVKPGDIAWLLEKMNSPKCVAMGEIGLDAVKTYSPMPQQKALLFELLALAREANKPVIFHSRGAEAEVLQAAVSLGISQAVFHCYTGSPETAQQIIQGGYYISFAGFLTYKKGLPEWLSQIPDERILIETDCPYLAPVPFRGKQNEPSYISHTNLALAKALNLSPEECAGITARNASRFFGIPL
jgi:TatD DNase family protein